MQPWYLCGRLHTVVTIAARGHIHTMRVYKFGGASISNTERILQVIHIVQSTMEQQATGSGLLLVVSAMGKTTNALEKVAEAFFAQRTEEALQLFGQIRQQHTTVGKYLLVKQNHAYMEQLADVTTEAEWLLHDKPVRSYAYYYDQIVCLGELLSTILLYHTLLEHGLPAAWLDVRDILRTNDLFREAEVDLAYTQQQCTAQIVPLLQQGKVVITQGFVGSTDQNESTTLGREGSDYSAALLSSMLPATELTIWKDVPAVLSADPRRFADAVPLPHLSYAEVVEMAYYGAQVIHPKTIQPLQNARIPMQVRCFLDPAAPGTRMDNKKPPVLPPMVIQKDNQVLMRFTTLNFAFAAGEPLSRWHALLHKLHLQPNLVQHGAIDIWAVLDDHPEKITNLALEASAWFEVQVMRQLSLRTLRHYNAAALGTYIEPLTPLLLQKTATTVQILYQSSSS